MGGSAGVVQEEVQKAANKLGLQRATIRWGKTGKTWGIWGGVGEAGEVHTLLKSLNWNEYLQYQLRLPKMF